MPVIMMSGHATVDTDKEATRIAAVDLLEKPIAMQKLLEAVKQGLERKVIPPQAAAQKVATKTVGAGAAASAPQSAAAKEAAAPPENLLVHTAQDASQLRTTWLDSPLHDAP